MFWGTPEAVSEYALVVYLCALRVGDRKAAWLAAGHLFWNVILASANNDFISTESHIWQGHFCYSHPNFLGGLRTRCERRTLS